MKSTIYASEVVANRERRFGAATIYYPARLVRSDGSTATLLFTDAELSVAADRARGNPEDLEAAIGLRNTERRSLWTTVALLAGCGIMMAAVIAGVVLWPV